MYLGGARGDVTNLSYEIPNQGERVRCRMNTANALLHRIIALINLACESLTPTTVFTLAKPIELVVSCP